MQFGLLFYKVLWTELGVSLHRMYLLKRPGYTDRADVSPPICLIMILKARSFFSSAERGFYKNLSFSIPAESDRVSLKY